MPFLQKKKKVETQSNNAVTRVKRRSVKPKRRVYKKHSRRLCSVLYANVTTTVVFTANQYDDDGFNNHQK